MATIRHTHSGRYEVQIRKSGLRTITKTFASRALTCTYIKDTEAKIEKGLYMDFSLAESTTLLQLAERYETEILPTKKGYQKEIYNIRPLKKALLTTL